MFCEHYVHEFIKTNEGIVVIDVANTWDAGWEGAYAMVDEEGFANAWGNEHYTFQDIKEWAAEFDCIGPWEVVSSHHRTPEAAEKKLRLAIKKNFT